MTIAQKSKETGVGMKDGRMEMGSVFVLYIQPTIPTYTHYYLKLPELLAVLFWVTFYIAML